MYIYIYVYIYTYISITHTYNIYSRMAKMGPPPPCLVNPRLDMSLVNLGVGLPLITSLCRLKNKVCVIYWLAIYPHVFT